MNRFLALMTLIGLPVGAYAEQPPQVPGIQQSVTATATGGPITVTNGPNGQPLIPPAGWPPAPQTLSPAPALDSKERKAVSMATDWRNHADHPVKDAMGVLRWRFGVSQPRVVCAPLQICDIELRPGEVINNVRIGDAANWDQNLSWGGGPNGAISHITLSPHDAAAPTSMLIYTSERTYPIQLVATRKDYTPLTGFTYPDDHQADNQAYMVKAATMRGPQTGGGGDPGRIEMLDIKGDNPSWRPTSAYTDGRKTYIMFPREMQFGESPTLVGVNDDGGIFSTPTERRVIYRWMNDRIVVDSVQDKLKLVLGVGGSQKAVTVIRRLP